MTAVATVTGTGPARADARRRPGAGTRSLAVLGGCGVLLALVVASVSVGARDVTADDIIAGLAGADETIAQAAVATRVPRTLLAVLAGAALALSGAVMQAITRNPLADPGILGVNAGSSLAIVIGMAWFGLSSSTSMIWTAILGAVIAAVFVYVVGSLGGGATPLKLALAGAATAAALACFITAISLPRNDIAANVRSWQIGGVGGATPERTWQVLPFLAVGAVVCLLLARSLDSLALGDEMAAGLGERVVLARLLATVGAVTLCGSVTAVCGPIGFVGLVTPHLCRLLMGTSHRRLLPAAALAGAILLLASDVVGRIVVRPAEIDVGIITAFVGAPFFIMIVRRQKVREL